MNSRLTRVAVASGFASTLVVATASCTYLPRAAEANVQAAAASARPAPLRIVQLNFGQNAYFAACAEPACPALTPKTLSVSTTQPVAAAFSDTATKVVPTALAADLVPSVPPRAASVPASAPRSKRADTHILLTFPSGSATLTAESRQTLHRSLRLARDSDRIVISGRTDSVGPEDINQQLALARALAVRNFIRDAVPELPSVIAIDAKGRCCFVAPNDDENGRSRNRRVEVVFTSSGVM
ncbi:MAG: OmpA family protein [Polyangiaceae bacterium]|jgi:outer membrane protein OmpA-like peptidoglycan-associated protein|nr:OmpA family protein [Polyangiaceae bacterium]